MSTRINRVIIAIDGYSSTGKSTYAKLIAKELGYIYVDTGAMYRAVTLHCMEAGLFNQTEKPDINLVNDELKNIHVHFHRNPETGENETCLGNRIVEKEIRTMEVSAHVSYISTIEQVRTKMVSLQRELGTRGGVVMDGRDIGTVVYPSAQIKIFMTASADVRANRRMKELEGKGMDVTLDEVMANIEKRDRIDSGRAVSPLKQAEDAVMLDNSNMTIADQMRWFYETFGSQLEK